MKTAAAFPARLFRGTQDRFLIFYLSLKLFDLRFEPIGFRNPVFQLFVLGVHDELRFRAIPAQNFEMLWQLRLPLKGARLMVHDLLDLPAIGQERIEPDLSRFERGLLAHRLVGLSLRVDSGRRDPVDRN